MCSRHALKVRVARAEPCNQAKSLSHEGQSLSNAVSQIAAYTNLRNVAVVKVKSRRHVYLPSMSGDSDNQEFKHADYRDFISDEFMAHIQPQLRAVEGVPDLFQVGESGGWKLRMPLGFCANYLIL